MDEIIKHCQESGTRWREYLDLANGDPRAASGLYALDVLAATGKSTQALDARISPVTGNGEYMGPIGQAAIKAILKLKKAL